MWHRMATQASAAWTLAAPQCAGLSETTLSPPPAATHSTKCGAMLGGGLEADTHFALVGAGATMALVSFYQGASEVPELITSQRDFLETRTV